MPGPPLLFASFSRFGFWRGLLVVGGGVLLFGMEFRVRCRVIVAGFFLGLIVVVVVGVVVRLAFDLLREMIGLIF